jgi:hypothetical protein
VIGDDRTLEQVRIEAHEGVLRHVALDLKASIRISTIGACKVEKTATPRSNAPKVEN